MCTRKAPDALTRAPIWLAYAYANGLGKSSLTTGTGTYVDGLAGGLVSLPFVGVIEEKAAEKIGRTPRACGTRTCSVAKPLYHLREGPP